MPLPSDGKSVLMTPDPYHTPGYGGFCPQFKYQIGNTFGKTTCRLLGNTNVASSGKLVLADIRASAPAALFSGSKADFRSQLLRSRTQSWGDQKLVERMIPGYTGFIPRSEHYFGKRYAETCKSAIADFEVDQKDYDSKLKDLKITEVMQQGKEVKGQDGKSMPAIRSRYFTPLKPVASEAKPYISKSKLQHSKSPFYMANGNPQKCFMSGYTGFVPRSRGQLGMGYPIITNLALNEFTDDIVRAKSLDGSGARTVTFKETTRPKSDGKPIYPIETGLVPHYTGHIPGQKFRYGGTFGHSTENALKVPKELTMSA
ncbi:ciliary microtubule inner protein 2B-like [Mytilus trossulus]|uniref:ciliary microtubule inner protein 2B-like n=1 Tax=Mytilus trossulus TaxID=6551 RepID=UPI0030052BBD